MNEYVLLLGSDLGKREENIGRAIEKLKQIGHIVKYSDIVQTLPWGFKSDTKFLNQAILFRTPLDPEVLMKSLISIEDKLGRERKPGWASRTIDIDILCSGDMVYRSNNVQIPHPLLHERFFALFPLTQVVGGEHPVLGKKYTKLLAEIY